MLFGAFAVGSSEEKEAEEEEDNHRNPQESAK